MMSEYHYPFNPLLIIRMKKTMEIGKSIYHLEIDGLVATLYRESKRAKSWRVYLMNARFTTEESMNKYVDYYINEVKRRELAKEQHKKERQDRIKEMRESLEVGDIIVNSWWYEQTNVDCYQIIEKKWANVVLREVAKKLVNSTWPMSWDFVPQKDAFIVRKDWEYKEITKRIGQFWVNFDYGGSSVWDWKRAYHVSWYGYDFYKIVF